MPRPNRASLPHAHMIAHPHSPDTPPFPSIPDAHRKAVPLTRIRVNAI